MELVESYLFFNLIYLILLLLVSSQKEALLSKLVFVFSNTLFLLWIVLLYDFINQDSDFIVSRSIQLFHDEHYQFGISFLLDSLSISFLGVLSFLSLLISRFARVYLHREAFFKKFFVCLALFQLGYSLVVLGNGFEILFAGWEFVGLSSFLLIAFYDYRVRPIKNALRVFFLYRLGDLGLLLGAWLAHQIWQTNPAFSDLSIPASITHAADSVYIIPLSLLLLLSASIKSAQFPFSYWLPKAMEGPTPSSAIFYGSLAVHLGVYLLLRSYPIWEHSDIAVASVFIVGLITVFMASSCAYVQSNIKAQLAYSASAQTGIIFMEIALGWHKLALVHFVGHAMLRAYQVLISASVTRYLISFQNQKRRVSIFRPVTWISKAPKILQRTAYVFFMREGFLEDLILFILWRPLKLVGSFWVISIRRTTPIGFYLIFMSLALWIYDYLQGANHISGVMMGIAAMAFALAAITYRRSAEFSWHCIALSQLSVLSSILLEDYLSVGHSLIFLSGVIAGWLLGLISLRRMGKPSLSSFRRERTHFGYWHILMLVCCLMLVGFPVSPTFIGEDLLLGHANQDNIWLAGFVGFSFLITGMASVRLYARTCMGFEQSTMGL